ncbi:MAG: hypothetical protein ACRDU5_18365 [Mycobacterium sp.]
MSAKTRVSCNKASRGIPSASARASAQGGNVRLGAGLDIPVENFRQLPEHGIVETDLQGGVDETRGGVVERGRFVEKA